MEINVAYNEDCIIGLNRIDDNSVDVVCMDPPYLYLKNQKLDVPFDAEKLFNHVKRILKPSGFVVMFGRGESFYRWNTKLSNLGFTFKEEIIWNKNRRSSPALNLSRVHETISIHTIGSGKIRKTKIKYDESRLYEPDKIITDLKRIASTLNNDYRLKYVIDNLKLGFERIPNLYSNIGKRKHNVTYSSDTLNADIGITNLNTMIDGFCEKSIINQFPDIYKSIHPTQKPVRLIERLLSLVSDVGAIVVDPFGGSFSTPKACINLGLNYIVFEIDKEFFDLGSNSLKLHKENSQSNGMQNILFK